MTRPRNHCVMNPFRTRLPEQVAERFLRQLKEGHPDALAATTIEPERREHVVENETKWPIQQWRIGSRRDTDGRVDLMYWVRRGNGYVSGADIEEEVYIVVAGTRGDTHVARFDAIY
jgi:hypothetical protein